MIPIGEPLSSGFDYKPENQVPPLDEEALARVMEKYAEHDRNQRAAQAAMVKDTTRYR